MLVNLSCELGQIITRYNFLGASRLILSNVRTYFQHDPILINFWWIEVNNDQNMTSWGYTRILYNQFLLYNSHFVNNCLITEIHPLWKIPCLSRQYHILYIEYKILDISPEPIAQHSMINIIVKGWLCRIFLVMYICFLYCTLQYVK